MSQGPMPWGSSDALWLSPRKGCCGGGETYLHPLVTNGSQVPGPSLKHRGGEVLDTPGGPGQPHPAGLVFHSPQAPSARETGPPCWPHWPLVTLLAGI